MKVRKDDKSIYIPVATYSGYGPDVQRFRPIILSERTMGYFGIVVVDWPKAKWVRQAADSVFKEGDQTSINVDPSRISAPWAFVWNTKLQGTKVKEIWCMDATDLAGYLRDFLKSEASVVATMGTDYPGKKP